MRESRALFPRPIRSTTEKNQETEDKSDIQADK